MTAVYLFKACKEAQLFDKDNSVFLCKKCCVASPFWHFLVEQLNHCHAGGGAGQELTAPWLIEPPHHADCPFWICCRCCCCHQIQRCQPSVALAVLLFELQGQLCCIWQYAFSE